MPLWYRRIESQRALRWFVAFALVGCLGWAEAHAWNPLVVGGRCKQSGSRCSGTIGNAGQPRGACCDPASGTAATQQCEKNNTCTSGRPYKWADSQIPVKWWFNPNNMPGKSGYSSMNEAQILGYLKQSWDAWTKPACTSFRNSYVGKSTNFLSANDRQTTMFFPTESQWAQMGAGPSTLAFTRPVPDNNGTLIDADMAFNPRPSRGTWTQGIFLATAAHEIGHAIGFAHTGDPKGLMYFAAGGGIQSLSADENAAVCFTYPKKGPCSKDSDCGGCLKCVGGKCVDKNISPVKNLCKPCQGPDDCGGSADICIRLEEGQRCAQACDNTGCCPNGYRCSDIGFGQKMCIPDSGKCPPAACTADTNCGPGETCQSGTCKPKPIPNNPKNCKACSTDADCGGGKCLRFDGQSRCLPKCVADNFCPTGYKCSATSAGRVCVPEKNFCPCNATSDCLSGEECRSKVCRPKDCKYGCACDEDAHCSPNHRCLQTQQGGGCFQPCGGSAGYPKGSPGSACNGQSCTGGAQCFNLGQGQTICMKPCRSASDCSATGGQCFNLGRNQAFCLCQDDRQCKNGQGCNKSILGQFGGGACAAKSAATNCEKGYKCQAAGGISICQPDGTSSGDKDVGEECSNPAACKAGLQCLQLEQGGKAHCFEECSGGKACSKGGSCILGSQGSERRFCGCSNPQAPCTNGQTCKVVGPNGIGICVGGTPPPKGDCGNGTCDVAKGETCGTCAQDCKCKSGESCVNNQCKPAASGDCGNGTCDIAKGETCGTCAQDCKCKSGETCVANKCTPPPKNCGDGTCDGSSNENCTTCPQDCACSSGQSCKDGSCQNNSTPEGGGSQDGGSTGNDNDPGNTLPCPKEDQYVDADGKPACPEPNTGCSGCSIATREGGLPVSFLFFALFGFFLLIRRR